jgi:arylsulfatase
MDEGLLKAEYNAMTLNRYKVSSKEVLPAGETTIEVIVQAQEKKPLAPSLITLKVNGKEVGSVLAETTVPAIFTVAETFDVGMDLGSAVALDYHARAPFKFNGTIKKVTIKYID